MSPISALHVHNSSTSILQQTSVDKQCQVHCPHELRVLRALVQPCPFLPSLSCSCKDNEIRASYNPIADAAPLGRSPVSQAALKRPSKLDDSQGQARKAAWLASSAISRRDLAIMRADHREGRKAIRRVSHLTCRRAIFSSFGSSVSA